MFRHSMAGFRVKRNICDESSSIYTDQYTNIAEYFAISDYSLLPTTLDVISNRNKKAAVSYRYGRFKCMGWLRGLEPPTAGTTIQSSNQLSHSHHKNRIQRISASKYLFFLLSATDSYPVISARVTFPMLPG